jgi:hypothetical protein
LGLNFRSADFGWNNVCATLQCEGVDRRLSREQGDIGLTI